jgi:hypothetical protein
MAGHHSMENALVDAVRAGNIAAVKSLLSQRSEVREVAAGAATRKPAAVGATAAGDLSTALHAAVAARRPDILALLLREEDGVRVDAKDGEEIPF